jgi:hypothetical protein
MAVTAITQNMIQHKPFYEQLMKDAPTRLNSFMDEVQKTASESALEEMGVEQSF